MTAAAAAAFWILVAVLAIRSYLALRSRGSTAFLGAIAAGVLGLFFLGAVVDDAAIDQALGGFNLVHLIRNILVTCAVWFVREGVFRAYAPSCRTRAKVSRHPLVLIVALSIITVAFFLQTFIPTTDTYVPDAVHQPPVYVYATIYMAFLAFLAMSAGRVCGEPQESRPVRVSARVMGVGMMLIAAASLDEILYMTMRFSGVEGALTDVTYALFKAPFYLGIVLVSVGLAIPSAVRLWRRLRIRDRAAVLYMNMNCSGDAALGDRVATGARDAFSSEPSVRLYECVVRELDRRVQHSEVQPSATADAALRFAQGSFGQETHTGVIRKVKQ